MKTAAILSTVLAVTLAAPASHVSYSKRQTQNFQTFTGALGGITATPIVDSGNPDRKFQVKGDTFVNIGAALQRSCDQQFNACANKANGGDKTLSVSACSEQQTQCNAAGQGNTGASVSQATSAAAAAAASSTTAAAQNPCDTSVAAASAAAAASSTTAAAQNPCDTPAASAAAAAAATSTTAAAQNPCDTSVAAAAAAAATTSTTAAAQDPCNTAAASAASASSKTGKASMHSGKSKTGKASMHGGKSNKGASAASASAAVPCDKTTKRFVGNKKSVDEPRIITRRYKVA